MNQRDIKMFTPTTVVLILIMAVGAVAAFYRLFFGLGASTHLNDVWPWGLWISFDVLGGVAMAAGGFVIGGTVYILNWKKYEPIVRPALLNAFFGYALAATSITLDIGVPWRIWHPLVMWQINSIMFIVAIHVVLYTSTLAAESSPLVFEKLNMRRAFNFMEKIMPGIVLFGVLLSLLHQSSLGAVYLIAPTKLSPLWYNVKLPYMFLVSAVMLALSMVSFETILSSRVFKHEPPMDILYGMARGSVIVIGIYFVLKMWDLFTGAGVGLAFNGSLTSNMYLLEMIIGVILPLALLLMKNVRGRLNGIFCINVLVITGTVLNRLNVGIFGLAEYNSRMGHDYFPSWMEIVVTLAMIAFAVVGFKASVKYLNVLKLEH
ncbi:MAG: Ni/Fe-hydrogenase cytochrome b subunit [Thermodesulfovibrionales bacterium]